ncbi:TadE-like protein [Novipirellula galeiformis]|uniref:TadE-like protein n=1 Tax=Novipirellula galeiformis TaxID=2528004 RepID=A0A5C6CG22_9BACT|nr:TadE/TadG family type IV pilus assembly protein [Novipirellula galeiformis]TWU23903.1 TadE-like protein [Novipirellula galeiformis]
MMSMSLQASIGGHGPVSRGSRTQSTARQKSCGIAAVEFAVVLPPLLLLVLVSVEMARAITVQHSLQEASMNGCRIYALRDTTQQKASKMIELSLNEAGISGHSIQFSPATKGEITKEMQPVTVAISVPYNQVGVGVQWFLAGSTVTARTTLPAESP